jgi:hypothetical protein
MTVVKRTGIVTTSGSAGSATGSKYLDFSGIGRIHGLRIEYTGQPATCDVTLADHRANFGTVFQKLNSNTNSSHYPVAPASKSADATASTATEVPPIAEDLDITVAGGNPGGTVKVIVFLEL